LETIKQFIEPSAGTGIAAAMREATPGKTGIILCGGNMDVRGFTLR
jgi:threonine dehydratase